MVRDRAEESALRQRLLRAGEAHGGREPYGLGFHSEPPEGLYEADVVLPVFGEGDEAASGAGVGFAHQAVPELGREGWRVRIEDTWPFRVFDGPVSFSTSLEPSDTDWFSLCLRLEADGVQFDIAPVVMQLVDSLPVDEGGRLAEGFDVERHLAGRLLHAEIGGGMYLAIDASRFSGFAEAFLEAQGLVGLHRAEAGRLFELAEALEGCGAPWSGGRELLVLGARLNALAEAPDVAQPESLRGELRAYQRTGYGWLKALAECGFGGVLADDMGLGKTVQTLALLAHRHLEFKVRRPSLLVVPTSLVGNWRREAARFAPELKLLVLHGPDRRRRFGDIPGHHLVVTTYPLVNRDHEALFAHDYDTAVLDEAQAVKNPAAGVSKLIRDIRARQRLALTGTPMENSLQELWSLYDWLIPGLLGSRKSFAKQYRTPIEKHGDAARQRLLSTRIKPFLLRRTKDEVAAELPPKTVIDERVALEGAQAALYESIRIAMDSKVREAVAERGLAASRIAILDALLKLRQVCCDPGLVKLDAAGNVKASAKRERLLELLEALVAEGRSVLVFSQFVAMLRLVEADVTARGWDYAMLHGGTKDRDEQVARFQSGAVPLFLISLKAGGTGLNLTAADTVVVYDPWWNPAVERQAMDRAHRIGQDKPVFVHRLIADNTVEAAIQRLQARKQALADALFEGTGQGPLGITEGDLDALFAASPASTPG
ncbi:MAG: DEAD/DEAH box helicase [Rhodospirillaceae bacterium]|nr:DEAD/DEAH box helicase [Rhodospirillaceae bacterium]